jgi:hypothetical protein
MTNAAGAVRHQLFLFLYSCFQRIAHSQAPSARPRREVKASATTLMAILPSRDRVAREEVPTLWGEDLSLGVAVVAT